MKDKTMTTWFTSDQHFGHRLVSFDRGFGDSIQEADTETHDQLLISKWKATVQEEDTIWMLGDLVGKNRHYRHALDILAELPGHKHLIAGNHDRVSPIHKDSHKFQREYLEIFESVQAYARQTLPVRGEDGLTKRHEALLSHYPYVGVGADHTDKPRYAQSRLPDHGTTLIHGHTHMSGQTVHRNEFSVLTGDSAGHGGIQVHVGLDAWDMELVSLKTVVQLIEEEQAR